MFLRGPPRGDTLGSELDHSHVKANVKVAENLYRKATEGRRR